MEDYIIRAMAGNGSVRAFAANTRQTVEEARVRHNTTPVASAALGRMLTAAAIMGCDLKGDKDLLTLQIRGNGPLGGIVATSDSKCRVKGYVFNPNVDIPSKGPGKLDVSGAVGRGSLSVAKDVGLKEPYSGQIELVSGEIAEDLTYYFSKSEQIPSSVGLGVLIDVDGSVMQSGGFFVQLLPDADEGQIDILENNLKNLPPVSGMLGDGMTPESILERIFKGMELILLDKVPVGFYCNCSKEKVEKALISLGTEEILRIIEQDGKATLHCHFCNKDYDFNKEGLNTLIEEINRKN